MGDSNDRLKAARLRRFPGSKASAIAKQYGWKVSTYLSHENGQTPVPNEAAHRYAKPYKASPGWILTGEGKIDAQNLVKLMGSIGAGGDIDPDYEQAPPDGFDEIELPFQLGLDAVAFEVKSTSMQPKFDHGDIVVCSQGPRNPEDFIGKLVAVRTSKGKRYLKKLRPGSKRGLYSLHSFNDDPIEDVKVAWIGEVLAIIPGYRVAPAVAPRKRAVG